MADGSGIEWTDATWPVVQGCDYASPGCTHCYAVPLLWRMAHHPDPKISGPLQGVVNKDARGKLHFTGKVALREDRLDWPLKWREPRRIFIPSHGDLFHPAVPDAFIRRVFEVMFRAHQHIFQVLTKRSDRMRAFCAGKAPLRNVWLGVSVEDQARADERIPDLLATPAAKRFLSCEPLLSHIDLRMLHYDGITNIDALTGLHGVGRPHASGPRIDWTIGGGESGPGARPCHPEWARKLRDDCAAAGVAFFWKQWGEFAPSSEDEWLNDDGTHQHMLVAPDGRYGNSVADLLTKPPGTAWVRRVGKKAAGRLLDGREWSEFPA